MKYLITTIAALVLVGCGESQQTTPEPEAKPVAQSATPEPKTAKATDISIHEAAGTGNIEAVKKHLDMGTDVNEKDDLEMTPLLYADTKEIAELLIAKGADVDGMGVQGMTPLNMAASAGHAGIAELLISKGAEVNANTSRGGTPLDFAIRNKQTETTDLLRKHGGKTDNELKAEGK